MVSRKTGSFINSNNFSNSCRNGKMPRQRLIKGLKQGPILIDSKQVC